MRRALAVLTVLVALASVAAARSGGGQNYYSGGSSYHSSSYGSSSYGSSSGGGDLLVNFVFLWLQFVLLHPLVGMPMTLVLAYFIIKVVTLMNGSDALYRPLEGGSTPEGGQLSSRKAEELARLSARDPDFDAGAFLARASAAFLKIQQAWSDGDMAPARAFISDGVYERFTLQLADMTRRGVRNRMEDVRVLETELLACRSDRHFDTLWVRVKAFANDRMTDLQGNPADGSAGAQSFEEVWTFLRRPGAKTLARKGSIEGLCPSCGAPLLIADSGLCGACKSWVNSGDYDWVLAEITQSCEWTLREPSRDVDGWAAAQASDPALNLPSLEDRASVAFWRWLEARRRSDAAPLRGIASDACCDALAAEMKEKPYGFLDAAVGGVEVVAFEDAGPQTRVHVMVKWSGRKDWGAETGEVEVRRHFVVMSRARAAKTDARQGLRTARCPSCGAPSSGSSVAACAYCGKPLNDGSKDWVMTGFVPFGEWRRPAGASRRAQPAGAGVDWGSVFSPAEAFAILAQAMLADGEVSLAETSFLQAYAASRGLPAARASDIVAAAKAGILDAPRPANEGQADAMLRGMIRMSLADGVVTAEERSALDSFAVKNGLAGEVDRLVLEEREAMGRSVRGVA